MSIHFNTAAIPFDKKVEILNYAYHHCYDWWVHVLDCSKSFHSQPIDMSFEEMMRKFNDRCYFTIIYRQLLDIENHLEIGFCTLEKGPEYFLWINMDSSYVDYFIEKYNLKEIHNES